QYLGAMRYTTDEMEHAVRNLSGGQKAKVLLLKMNLDEANVLILDEPTRNFSPLSAPVIRNMIREFKGCVISVSHDRLYIRECADTVYRLDESGLHKTDQS
ncbi:MAG: ATP-binding cassette domain-containing protein, partial [Erysipelotrichaceae bacterium]|nr:ATP-binding cassette domain-containing protein [Erysipelotrichaceae bacterium]